MIRPIVTNISPDSKKGVCLEAFVLIWITVPDRVDLDVFKDSSRVIERALRIGIRALRKGIIKPIAIASSVANADGQKVVPSFVAFKRPVSMK